MTRHEDLVECIKRLRGITPYETCPYVGDTKYAQWIVREFKPEEIETALAELSLTPIDGISMGLTAQDAQQTTTETPNGGHSERVHAKLSASGSKRWLTCTPSARLEESFEDNESEFAQEGTSAHEYSEILLRIWLGGNDGGDIADADSFARGNRFFSEEMADYCQRYVDLVIERYNAALAIDPSAQISIEERLDFSRWVPDGFGTGDVSVICSRYIEVIDLKYGKGVKVDAEGNTQMRLYGLGAYDAYEMLYEFKEVRMTIVQPRLDHYDTEVVTVEDLLKWADEYVKPRAVLADAGEGEFCAGDHCKFCKAKAVCAARADANLEMAKYEFKRGEILTVEEIGEILAKAEELQKWAGDIQAYALEQAEKHGVKFPGWKLVEGRSNRKYTDEEEVASSLEMEGFTDEQIYNKKLKGVTDLTKALGKKKFEDFVGPFIIKPPGKPALVPESDKRPELSSTESAISDFE